MGRRLALLFAITALGGVAVMPRAAAAIVCPLAGERATTCCGPPTAAADSNAIACCAAGGSAQPICCPPNALCVVPLSISSSSDPSRAGEKVTISGRLSTAGAGTTITLWERLPGQSHFGQVAQTKTDSAGSYKFSRRPDTDRRWYVTGGSKTSATLQQQVQARIRITASKSSVSPGSHVTVSGSVTPRHNGERVMIQRLVSGSWQTVASYRLRSARFAARSRFRGSVAITSPGTWELRAEFAGDARNISSSSRSITVTA